MKLVKIHVVHGIAGKDYKQTFNAKDHSIVWFRGDEDHPEGYILDKSILIPLDNIREMHFEPDEGLIPQPLPDDKRKKKK